MAPAKPALRRQPIIFLAVELMQAADQIQTDLILIQSTRRDGIESKSDTQVNFYFILNFFLINIWRIVSMFIMYTCYNNNISVSENMLDRRILNVCYFYAN